MTIEKLGSGYDELVPLWEASVRSSHSFLSEIDIRFYKALLSKEYFPAVRLYMIRNNDGLVLAFMGVSDELIEMLFVHPDAQGKGYGKALIDYAVWKKHIYKVDVNEQNTSAFNFYRRQGFKVIGRDDTDAYGKPFPILHMQINMNRFQFYRDVYDIVKEIPSGYVMTYGQIATLTGKPQCSRMVGKAMFHVPEELHIPSHRVVNSLGRLVPSWPEQERLLEQEGISFKKNKCVDMKKHQWKPEEYWK